MRVKKVINIMILCGLLGALIAGCNQSNMAEDEKIMQTDTSASETEEISEIIEEVAENQTTEIEENIYQQNDAYKIFYGTWEITSVVCEHSRLGGDDGYEDVIGWQIIYLPTLYECNGVSIENPNYLMTIFPAGSGYAFINDFIVMESLLPDSDYYVWVQIVDKPLGVDFDEYGSEPYTGCGFFIKDDTTLYCEANNCVYELTRVSYMDGYDVQDVTTIDERW